MKVKNRFLVAMFVFSVAELIVVVFLIFFFPEVVFHVALPFPSQQLHKKIHTEQHSISGLPENTKNINKINKSTTKVDKNLYFLLEIQLINSRNSSIFFSILITTFLRVRMTTMEMTEKLGYKWYTTRCIPVCISVYLWCMHCKHIWELLTDKVFKNQNCTFPLLDFAIIVGSPNKPFLNIISYTLHITLGTWIPLHTINIKKNINDLSKTHIFWEKKYILLQIRPLPFFFLFFF